MGQSLESGLTLGIESAVAGGSLSIFRGDVEISSFCGSVETSRAEALLPTISTLLERSGVSRRDITQVAVSLGPGSFTGIKIGIATAMGIAAGVGGRCSGVSVLAAMATAAANDGAVMTAVPVGRSHVCVQAFEKRKTNINANGCPELVTEMDFAGILQQTRGNMVLSEHLHEQLAHQAGTDSVTSVSNLATFISRACLSGICSEDLTPVFVDRKPVASVG